MSEEYVNDALIEVDQEKYLTFSIEDEHYALDIRYVEDIIGVQEITKVPDQPNYLIGVINLRGIIIPVIDIRLRFLKQEREYDDRTCIIVISLDHAPVGIVVDTVLEVVKIELENIAEPPNFDGGVNHQFMKGITTINDHLVVMVDCYALISEE